MSAWLRWGLVASLALNLFLLGFLGAEATRSHRRGLLLANGRAAASGEGPIALGRQLAAALPPADAGVLRQAFAARLPELARLRRRSQAAAEQVRLDIEAAPYDPGRVRADMLAAREARQAIRPVIEQILQDALPRMSAPGRKAFAEYRILPERS